MAEYRLEMKGICKSFPGVKALDGINLRVRPGTVHALMGENGAGKSTLMKCLFGIYKMDEGEIYLDGEKMTILNPDDALHKGLAMVHQELQPQRWLVHLLVSDRRPAVERNLFFCAGYDKASGSILSICKMNFSTYGVTFYRFCWRRKKNAV